LKKLVFILFLIPYQSFLFAQSYIEFVENKGQWSSDILFMGDIGTGKFVLTNNGYKVLVYDEKQIKEQQKHQHGVTTPQKEVLKSHIWDVNFIGHNPSFEIKRTKENGGVSNYYIGNNPQKWASNCKSYGEVTYKNVYDNIDVVYHTDGGLLKYDIIVKPGGDVNKIKLKYDGVDKIGTNKNGELLLKTSVGEFKELFPYSFQADNSGRRKIDCEYKIKNNELTFKLGDYNKNETLIIDPTLIFSTHSGSRVSNWGFTATYGTGGIFFGGGIVFGAEWFGNSPPPGNQTYGGGSYDMGIIKLSPDGGTKLYATYIGGDQNDQPHSLISDEQGNLYIAGRSNSSNYPVPNTIFGPRGGYDIVLTKLSPSGTLLSSIIVGGSGDDGVNISSDRKRNSLQYNYGDDGRTEINLDLAGNVVLASCTQSINFYTTPGAVQTANAGGQDAVLLKANSALSTIIFSSYFGGTNNDAAYVVDVKNDDGNIYFAGGTESGNLPGNKSGVIQATNLGSADGFITVINPSGTAIVKTSYLGTSSYDQIYGIKFDQFYFPYVMGISLGNWPVANAAYSNTGAHQFIAKLKKDLSGYEYSTKFGTGGPLTDISPVGFAVDKCQNIYVTGWGGQLLDFTNNGTSGMPITADALKSSTDGKDFYYMAMSKNANSLLFGSFFGGNQSDIGEHVDGGTSRFDRNGVLYQAACASCLTNPNVAGEPYTYTLLPNGASTSGQGGCNLGMTKIAFDFQGVGADLVASDVNICLGEPVDFEDVFLYVDNTTPTTYEFNFGDGSPDVMQTSPKVTYTYNRVGVFRVRLIAINLNTCNLRDTSYLNVRVRDDKANLSFDAIKQPPCTSLTYLFDNTSTPTAGKPFSNNTFTWTFGDNEVRTTNVADQTKTYATEGVYTVRLILNDTNYCNAPDTVEQIIRLSPNVKADFEFKNGCAPFNYTFKNISKAGVTFIWEVNGVPVTGTSNGDLQYLFTTPGDYKIKLTANDPVTCNLTDFKEVTITVHPKPTAGFTFSPNPSLPNTPTLFNNSSTGAVTYKWFFGDGETSDLINPLYQFNSTGTFKVDLVAITQFGCTDTATLSIPAIVNPLLDVPNAFTPNGDGKNDKVFVRGFGISTIVWRIFNRWGQIVFETNQRNVGWDGTYKGKLQPMDAYAYTLQVTLSDGRNIKKSGDITLIR
jgi:gliding motility-associated-like protein